MQNKTISKQYFYHPEKDEVEILHCYLRPAAEQRLEEYVVSRIRGRRLDEGRKEKFSRPHHPIWQGETDNHLAQVLESKKNGWQQITEKQYQARHKFKTATAFQENLVSS